MAKAKKITLKKVKKARYLADVNEVEHEFEFTDFSSKELSETEATLEAQHEALKANTTCVTEGVSEKDAEGIVDDFFDFVWEELPAGEFWKNMNELLGNDKKKK